jgi:hypothetical protein
VGFHEVLLVVVETDTREATLETDDMTKIDSIAGDQEVIVTPRLKFKPGAIDHVLSEIAPAVLTREETGNIQIQIYRAQDDVDRLVLFERWANQAALRAFEAIMVISLLRF